MTSRSRSMVGKYVNGKYLYISQDALKIQSGSKNYPTTTYNKSLKITNDYLDNRPYPDHILDITERRVEPPRIYGEGLFLGSRLWEGKVDGMTVGFPVYTNVPTAPTPAWAYYTTKALVLANPNTPKFDLPLFLWELKDLPSMLKNLGDILAHWRNRKPPNPQDIAGYYLAYSFGWKPLFNDLKILLNLADLIEQKKREFLEAAKKGGRKVGGKVGKNNLSLSTTLSGSVSFAGLLHASCRWVLLDGKEEAWFTARQSLFSDFTKVSLDTAAFRAVLGLNLNAATIWNMLPWSFLIDYFVNIGDFLAATRGFMTYKVTKLNVMCHQVVKWRSERIFLHPNLAFKEGFMKYEYKGRRLPNPSIPLLWYRPWWTNTMIANVSALLLRRIPH